MSKYFIPYCGNSPAAVDVKGHRLLLVTSSQDDLVTELARIGADQVKEVFIKDNEDDQHLFARLATSIEGGVVLTPPGISISTMLQSLEQELPWIH